ncbi:unnamed protein product [Moneuplotes crassus]|uniref:Uncharacterized protein n=2 Tax=Euplotes crassus TaxID=5936 RepID=A0AAD1XID6_EUPCR|nr:unnamed protein product [Moneuplotes crassus]
MIIELGDEDHKKEISEDFTITVAPDSDIKVYEKGIAGQTDYPCLCAKFDDNDEFIVATHSNGSIEIHEADSCDYVCHLEPGEEESKKPVCTLAKWRPGAEPDAIIAVDIKGGIRRYSKNEEEEIASITPEDEDENRLFALDYASDGKTFATGGTDHFVRVYDDETMKLKVTLDPFYTKKPGHTNRIFSVAFNKTDPTMIASGGWDSTVIIHDIRQKGPVAGILGPYICGDAIDFTNWEVITGSWRNDNQLQKWDTRTTEKTLDIEWDGDNFDTEDPVRIFSLTKSHNDSINSFMVAGGGEGDELRVFNKDYTPVARISDVTRSIFTTDVAKHADAFLFSGGDGIIRVCKVIVYN